ncbi:uncharacterized protein LOC127849102 [Dreissena polymorpha]|uniref:uncharacterized protein LOC127849102 n=1 Tax=Dreissena polymorpha TaxID=45954 RepID=UPI002264A3B4|nr:uncharacterized protein LOC127849102 [Dreissena polymorpha]
MSAGAEPCSRDICYHYSWDFAQNVHFPHHAQQVGPIYFCSPRKCHVFGMCAEGSGKQVFYLIDEAELPEKGAESVVSLAHHHFQHFGVGEKHAEIHFDNAVGQNKNHTVIWYAMWRTLTDNRLRLRLRIRHRMYENKLQPVSPFHYQKLLALGFRPSTLLLDPDCVYDATCHRACSTHAPQSRKESPQKPDAPSEIAARSAVDPQM